MCLTQITDQNQPTINQVRTHLPQPLVGLVPNSQSPAPPGTVIYNAQPGLSVVGPTFGRDPVEMHCPHCKLHILTSTKAKPGTTSMLSLCDIIAFQQLTQTTK